MPEAVTPKLDSKDHHDDKPLFNIGSSTTHPEGRDNWGASDEGSPKMTRPTVP